MKQSSIYRQQRCLPRYRLSLNGVSGGPSTVSPADHNGVSGGTIPIYSYMQRVAWRLRRLAARHLRLYFFPDRELKYSVFWNGKAIS